MSRIEEKHDNKHIEVLMIKSKTFICGRSKP